MYHTIGRASAQADYRNHACKAKRTAFCCAAQPRYTRWFHYARPNHDRKDGPIELLVVIIICALNHHSHGIRYADKDLAARHSYIPHLHATKHIDLSQVRTTPENAADDKVCNLLAKCNLELSQLRIDLVRRKDLFKRTRLDVATAKDVEVCQGPARMCHECPESIGAQANLVGVLARIGRVELAAFLEIHKLETRIFPIGKEPDEALISHAFAVCEPQFPERTAIVVDRVEHGVVRFVYAG